MVRLSLSAIKYFSVGLVSGLLLAYQISILFSSSITICSLTKHRLTDELPRNFDEHSHNSVGGLAENPIAFSDEKYHKDASSVADDLSKRVRILCWVLTHADQHKTHAVHIQATWGKRCNKLIFISDKEDSTLPVFVVRSAYRKGRDGIGEKVMQGLDHVYNKYFHEADWFLKADDDTYVIVENLRYLLSNQNTSESIFFGHHFKTSGLKVSYPSGGAGYVMSKEALRRFAHRSPGLCLNETATEDVAVAKCLHALGVTVGDSRDILGRSRFHAFTPQSHMEGRYPEWYFKSDYYGGLSKGLENISDYAITFHYMSIKEMYVMELYVYHIHPYGVTYGLQDLNQPRRINIQNVTNNMKLN